MQNEEHQANNKQDMNQAGADVKGEKPQQPENNQNGCD